MSGLYQSMLAGLRTATGLPWAFWAWAIPPPLPYGVIVDGGEDVLSADNRRLAAAQVVVLELYDANLNPAAEDAIENWLNANFPAWTREARGGIVEYPYSEVGKTIRTVWRVQIPPKTTVNN